MGNLDFNTQQRLMWPMDYGKRWFGWNLDIVHIWGFKTQDHHFIELEETLQYQQSPIYCRLNHLRHRSCLLRISWNIVPLSMII